MSLKNSFEISLQSHGYIGYIANIIFRSSHLKDSLSHSQNLARERRRFGPGDNSFGWLTVEPRMFRLLGSDAEETPTDIIKSEATLPSMASEVCWAAGWAWDILGPCARRWGHRFAGGRWIINHQQSGIWKTSSPLNHLNFLHISPGASPLYLKTQQDVTQHHVERLVGSTPTKLWKEPPNFH